MFRSSRSTFLISFARHHSVRVFGSTALRHVGSLWWCQKHPWTRIAFRRRGNTTSGQPGRSRRCIRNRSPQACTKRRTASSGRVSFARMRDIINERSGVVTLPVSDVRAQGNAPSRSGSVPSLTRGDFRGATAIERHSRQRFRPATVGCGAGGRGRTDTLLPEPDFESGASANSATPARLPPSTCVPTAPILHLAHFPSAGAAPQPRRQPTVLTRFFQFAASMLTRKTKRFLSRLRLPFRHRGLGRAMPSRARPGASSPAIPPLRAPGPRRSASRIPRAR